MMDFQLDRWGDGTICLVHWDSLGGDDIVITLKPEQAIVCHRPVHLLRYLRGLIEAREARNPGG